VDGLPTCANCHSFSSDGKTLGLDLDGPQNDKGLYALVPIDKNLSIRNEDVIEWSSFRGKLGGKARVGFMSRVSPDGQKVVTMVNPSVLLPAAPPAETAVGATTSAGPAGTPPLPKDVQGSFYVANFKDYRFLQVFYPTRGILAWYSRETGILQPLPGADDPRYVHTNAVWSPDGDYLVFARAEARDPYPEGVPRAERANDPNETPVQYDLYRIPFNGGKGGVAEPVAGASRNNKSNSFPKISPDGKWIVFVQANNGLLMRPDSQLYIVPVEGGDARLMTCNTPLMNSWHSFSPNGRWLVFSSKSRGPYTKMFLTHIDENGNDSPPILIENATAANRAVNLPEFVNIPRDAWLSIDAPATEFYRLSDNALELMQKGEYAASIAEWNRALAMEPGNVSALSNYGAVLTAIGEFERADELFNRALASDPENYKAYSNLGVSLARRGRFEDAAVQLRKALYYNPNDVRSLSTLGGILLNTGQTGEAMGLLREALDLDPLDVDTLNNLGGGLARAGKFGEAIPHFEKALELQPNSFEPHYNLGRAVAAVGRVDEGIRHLERAVELSRAQEPAILDRLSAMYAEKSRFAEAATTARKAMELARRQGDNQLAESLNARIALYESNRTPAN
jgi:tetratricopeptide (TPR) repeat protein